MNIYETIGFFWIVVATGLFTAQLLIAAGYALVIGCKTMWRQWGRGEQEEERDHETMRLERMQK